MYPKPAGGGGSRGPQFYRDLMLASHSGGGIGSPQAAHKYKPATTTESYLFSPPSAPADAVLRGGERRAVPPRANSSRGIYSSPP
jgi:hypothetical protein